jgi:uncharacterized LabA/DUF88 family protein
MLIEPVTKRAIAFIDGQNLFHGAREAFGSTHPDYDPVALARSVCTQQGWTLTQTRFYTGIPDAADNAFWHGFWTRKLQAMSRHGVVTFSRPLRYRNKKVALPDGTTHSFLAGEEKGIDIRITLDLIRLATREEYDIGIIFSQDQDLSEVADEIRELARHQQRWIKLAAAFPSSPTSRNRRGINGTDWIRIDRALCDSSRDTRDYRA